MGRLDILVNNSGIMDEMMPMAEVSDELWNEVQFTDGWSQTRSDVVAWHREMAEVLRQTGDALEAVKHYSEHIRLKGARSEEAARRLRYRRGLLEMLVRAYGERAEGVLEAVGRAPREYTVRVNTLRTGADRVVRELEEMGVPCRRSPVLEEAVAAPAPEAAAAVEPAVAVPEPVAPAAARPFR